jgi:spore coat polysaccharide biosynthesis predicted glycosyltransferase SpsG
MKFRFGAKTPRLLLGAEYAMLREEFRTADSIKVKRDASRVFVCFGGADTQNFTKKMIRVFAELKNVEFVVVFGKAARDYDEANALASANVTVLRDPPRISDAMRSCDAAFVSPSTMSYELAALGIPSIAVVQADNQRAIAEYWQENGLMRICGSWDDYSFEVIKSEISSLLLDYARRASESERLQQTVNKNGVYRIVEIISEAAESASCKLFPKQAD